MRNQAPIPYLVKEGKFLKYLAVWQWLVISLMMFGLFSVGAVAIMEKYYKETEADEKVFAINALSARRQSTLSGDSGNSEENE